MTLSELQALIASWIRDDVDDDLSLRETKSRIDFLGESLFNEYIAATGSGSYEFRHKLASWLAAAPDDESRKLMYRLLNHITFYGNEELLALYKTVYSRNIIDWILSTSDIQFLDPNARARIQQEINETCFVAITDSFDIGKFFRVNSISGVSRRIVFSSISPAPTAHEFKENYLQYRRRLVLLEDFVGSGGQTGDVVEFAASLGANQPMTLFSPLIICPAGDELMRRISGSKNHLSYKPVLTLPAKDFVTDPLDPSSPQLFSEFRLLARNVHSMVSAGGWPHNYGPLGYEQTGALVVKYDNCPDNTLPLIHHDSETPWSALFCRVSRE